MIGKPTVLILGAGASKPYGLPIGIELVDTICREILDTPNTGLRTRLENFFSERPGDAFRFAEALRGARSYSIDRFLEMNRPFRRIGKAAIADVLLRAEDSSELLRVPVKNDWYRYLFNILVSRDLQTFEKQARRLSIITFNFDRSLERALVSTLMYSFGLSERDAAHHAELLAIHHVHGWLGAPTWMAPADPLHANPYGIGDDTEQVASAVQRALDKITIVDEDVKQSVIEDLQVRLEDAAYVYFLGLAYDERNLKRLGVPKVIPPTALISGTALGLSHLEQHSVSRCFPSDKMIQLFDEDAYTFLRSHAHALFT